MSQNKRQDSNGLDEIMTRLLVEYETAQTGAEDDDMQEFYNEAYDDVYSDVYSEISGSVEMNPGLSPAERQRILQGLLRRIEEDNNMELNNITDNMHEDKADAPKVRVRMRSMGRRRWLTFGLAAVLVLAMSSLTLAQFGLAPDFLRFFNAGEGGTGALQPSGQEVMQQASDNGATLTVEQVVGDRHSVYVLLDFLAPEGVVLDKDSYDWEDAWVNAEGSTGCGYYFEMLPDDNPADNHIRIMLCLSTNNSLQGDTLNLNLGNLRAYDPATYDYMTAVAGSWKLNFKLDYIPNYQVIDQDATIKLGEATARVESIEISPISLILDIDIDNPQGYEPLPGYVEPTGGGVAMDSDGNEVFYDYGDSPVEVRLGDFLGDLDNLVVTLKDGTVLDTQGGGGHTELDHSQIIFSFNRILNVDDIASVRYCGQELTL